MRKFSDVGFSMLVDQFASGEHFGIDYEWRTTSEVSIRRTEFVEIPICYFIICKTIIKRSSTGLSQTTITGEKSIQQLNFDYILGIWNYKRVTNNE